jgi:DNA polymerase-1
MQIAGFAFDQDRARQLSDHLYRCERAAREAVCQATCADINPMSPNQLLWAFQERLHAPIYFRSALTGRPSLGVDTMRAYAASHNPLLREAALAVLEFRRAKKLRKTYIDNVCVGSDGRVHPTWLNYGTVSGRFACQGPNLMNLPTAARDPTADLGGIRSLYIAPPGHKLIYFDYSQLEIRIAAYSSGDPNMIAACETADVHSANAEALFSARFKGDDYRALKKLCKHGTPTEADERLFRQLEYYRRCAKESTFAVCYGAAEATVFARMMANGVETTMREVELMLRALHNRYAHYYRWQARRLSDTIRTGFVESPILGRRRYVGHDPDATLVMNHPIQSGAADIENDKLIEIVDTFGVMGLWGRIRLIAQVHDSNVFEVPDSLVDTAVQTIQVVCGKPVTIASSGSPLQCVLPIELEVLERWK